MTRRISYKFVRKNNADNLKSDDGITIIVTSMKSQMIPSK